jgi:lipopolysaccharide biosynthesis glycosyltransferase
VVYGVDSRFAVALAASMSSAVRTLGEHRWLEIFVIDGGLGSRHRRRLAKSFENHRCSITWLTPPHRKLARLKVGGEITVATYYRLAIAELLSHVGKVIYLDADVIVHRDLGELWDVPLGSRPLLAVQDQGVRYISGPYGLTNFHELGIPAGTKYFNAGVLVLDLERWREDRIAEAVVTYVVEQAEHIRFHDQDGLNAILWNRWNELDPRWNQMPQLLQVQRVEDSPFAPDIHWRTIADPYITHYASSDKPWHSGCAHPTRAAFFTALDETLYRGFRPSPWRDQLNHFTHPGRSRFARLRQWLGRQGL